MKTTFQRENPTFTVTSVASREGDGSTVYKHIRYRRPGSESDCEVVWGYQEAKPEWRVFYKGEPAGGNHMRRLRPEPMLLRCEPQCQPAGIPATGSIGLPVSGQSVSRCVPACVDRVLHHRERQTRSPATPVDSVFGVNPIVA